MRITDRPVDRAGKERVIMNFLVQGKTQPEIGRELGVSRAAVARILADLSKQYQVSNTVALVAAMAFAGTLPGGSPAGSAPRIAASEKTEAQLRSEIAVDILRYRPKIPAAAWGDPGSLYEDDKHVFELVTDIALSVSGRTDLVRGAAQEGGS